VSSLELLLTPPWVTFLVSLFAAGLAFSFFLLGQVILRAWDRDRDNRKALVRLERLFLVQRNAVIVLKASIALLPRGIARGAIVFDSPREIRPPDEALHVDLLNLDLVSGVLSLVVTIERINAEVANLNSAYGRIADLRISKKITLEEYKEHAVTFEGLCRMLDEALTAYEKEADELIAQVRALLKRPEPPALRLVNVVARKVFGRGQPTPQELENEREALAADRTALTKALPLGKEQSSGALPHLDREEVMKTLNFKRGLRRLFLVLYVAWAAGSLFYVLRFQPPLAKLGGGSVVKPAEPSSTLPSIDELLARGSEPSPAKTPIDADALLAGGPTKPQAKPTAHEPTLDEMVKALSHSGSTPPAKPVPPTVTPARDETAWFRAWLAIGFLPPLAAFALLEGLFWAARGFSESKPTP
jgi:hypothetical protein